MDHLTLVEIVLCVYDFKKLAIRPFPSAWCRETRVEENIRTRAYILYGNVCLLARPIHGGIATYDEISPYFTKLF